MHSEERSRSAGIGGICPLLAAACFGTFGMAFAGGGERPALIEGVVAETRAARVALGDAEQGRWSVSIRPQAFSRSSTLRDRGVDAATGPAVGVRFAVDLPERGRLELVIENLTEVVDGVTTMTGSLADEADGDFVLSLEGDQLLGTIEDGAHIWLIEPDAGGAHLLRKVHRGLIPRVPDDEDYRDSSTASEASMPKSMPAPMSGTNGGVDVLFLYASNVTNPNLRASDIVGRFTLVRNNSLISTNNSITSVGVYPVASSFAGLTRDAILDKMEDRTSPFTEIDNWMLHTNADIAFLLVSEDSTAPAPPEPPGYGRVGGVAFIFRPDYPFALSTITYALGDNTAIHELGHVFGGHHEGTHSNDPLGSEGSNHPRIAPDCSWMTIMGGYLDSCGFDGLPATTVRINYFSNPALNPAAAGGNVIGVLGSADMESWLEGHMPIVSGWQNNGAASAPAAPAWISHLSLQCWGDNNINWASVSGATEYRLFQSTTTSFVAPTQIYQGSGRSMGVSVPASGAYYRVHACNSAGCSHWAGTHHAPYFIGCP